MSFDFRPLLSISASHAWSGGASAELDFLLPQDAVKLLASARCLTRIRNGALHVLADVAEDGLPRVDASGRILRVGLKPSSAHFANVTADVPVSPFILRYRNAGTPTALDAPDRVRLVGHVFSHSFSRADRPVTAALTDADGHEVQAHTVTASADRPAVSFEMTALAPGALTVTERYADDSTHVTRCYLDGELARGGAVAVLELRLDASFHGSPPAFTVPFAAREETLRYYVVATRFSPTEAAQLAINDAGFGEDARPALTFTRIPSSSFTGNELPEEALGGADATVILFQSQAPLPRQRAPRRKLQLMRNGDVLIENLPHPSADRPNADVIVHVSKP